MSEPNQNIESLASREFSRTSAPAVSLPKARPINLQNREETNDTRVSQTSEVRSNDALKALGNVKLSITIDETEDLPVIKIFDSESGKELLQVPAEHSLNISRSIKAAVGAIFDKKA